MSNWSDETIGDWEARGRHVDVDGQAVFVVDVPRGGPPLGRFDDGGEPLLVVHGFPTSSFDFASVIPALARDRRVVLVDLLGFGLSAKPDRRYTMALQADVVARVVALLGLTRFALLTHDMGDTVGGELLARHAEGRWPVEITRRVVTNGSIYIDMANLTAGQLMLLDMPDELAPAGPGPDLVEASLRATLAPANRHVDMRAHAELVCPRGGDAALPRTIRYIEERRAHERRFTGAIESHPAPLHVIWGPEDPIAVAAMAERLVAVRPDATLTWMDGTGHYPQVEAPERFGVAVQAALA